MLARSDPCGRGMVSCQLAKDALRAHAGHAKPFLVRGRTAGWQGGRAGTYSEIWDLPGMSPGAGPGRPRTPETAQTYPWSHFRSRESIAPAPGLISGHQKLLGPAKGES